MRVLKVFLVVSLLSVSFFSCKEKAPATTPKAEEVDYTSVKHPAFNADSAYAFVEAQCNFGPRVPGTKEHEACAQYLIRTLQRFADTVYVQNFNTQIFNGQTRSGKNIIGSFGTANTKRILLAAHWDSRAFADHDDNAENHNKPVIGANDGASGVGVLLEVARLLSVTQPNVGVDIIFFDLEDQGAPETETSVLPGAEDWCLGSQYWAKNRHIPYYQANYGILLDMVGYHDLRFLKERVSMDYASSVMDKVWLVAAQLGYSNIFQNQVSGPLIDDHLFINRSGIPMIDIVQNSPDANFFPHWHTTNDNMSAISKSSLEKVGKVLMVTLFSE